MNAPHSPSPLAAVPMAPRDPILGVTEAFNADQNPNKVNLGVGVYYDDNGKVPLLECVRRAESERLKSAPPRGYLPIDGLAGLRPAVQALVFGADSPASRKAASSPCRRSAAPAASRSAPISCGALRPAARSGSATRAGKTIARCSRRAGFTVNTYPYYDADDPRRGFRRHASTRCSACRPGSIVVLHACCHNPTGVDLTPEQWAAVLEIVTRARPRALPRHRLPGLRRRHRCRRRRGAPLRRGDAARCSCRARSPSRSRSTASASAR